MQVVKQTKKSFYNYLAQFIMILIGVPTRLCFTVWVTKVQFICMWWFCKWVAFIKQSIPLSLSVHPAITLK